jgi:prophage antirepressor-like protein
MSSTNLAVFNFESFPVRTVKKDDDAWFVASDACAALGLGNASLAVNGRADRDSDGLDEEDRGLATVNTPSGEQQMLVVNESGLYNLIFKSRKPEAKKFKKWVTSEVLPAIRKTGKYQAKAESRYKFPTPWTTEIAGVTEVGVCWQKNQRWVRIGGYGESRGNSRLERVCKGLNQTIVSYFDTFIKQGMTTEVPYERNTTCVVLNLPGLLFALNRCRASADQRMAIDWCISTMASDAAFIATLEADMGAPEQVDIDKLVADKMAEMHKDSVLVSKEKLSELVNMHSQTANYLNSKTRKAKKLMGIEILPPWHGYQEKLRLPKAA